MPNAITLAQILEWTSGRLANRESLGAEAANIEVTRPADLAGSQASDCAFFFSKAYQADLMSAAPGILVTGEPFVAPLQASGLPIWRHSAIVACGDPYLAMAILSKEFALAGHSSMAHVPSQLLEASGTPEIHSSAIVDPTAKLAAGVVVGPGCVVEAGVTLGKGTLLYPRVYLGKNGSVGEGSVLFPGVTVYENVKIGKRARIHAGAVIGADGFGFAPVIQNGKPIDHAKIYHFGCVVIGDDVEIGANALIDRATLGETTIASKCKLDNDVHIGHNTRVGEGTIFCGKSGTAGGAVVGRFVYVGGGSGIGKVTVGDYVKIGGATKVDIDVAEGETVVGNPVRSYRDHFRVNVLLNRLLEERTAKKKRDPS